MSPESLANKLIQARLERRKVRLLPEERPVDWAAARETADLACIGAPHAWKLGGTTQAVRDIFGINMPFYGPLAGHEVFDDGEPAPLPPLPGPVAEPEIAVRLGADVPPRRTQRSDEEVIAFIEALAPCLDIAAVALESPPDEGVLSLIADRAGTGILLVGPWQPASDLPRLKNRPVRLLLNGAERSKGSEGALIGGLIGALRDFFTEAAREDLTLKQGDIIATGGLSPAIPIEASKNVTAVIEGWAEAHFDLEHDG